ncbi:MAG TPA: TadE/TadG family type IV pilus assembly protein [Chloroflexota bacterium]|nr:TadE/TadG family type IV pilus assembly protein [Chloroflexota bacterium]
MTAARIRPALERATSSVELALIIPVLLLLVIGTFDLSWGVILSNMTSQGAREGARAAIVRLGTNPVDHSCMTSVPSTVATPIASAARDQIATFAGSTYTVSTTAGGSPADGCYVEVRVTTTYQPMTGSIVPVGATQVGATSRMTIP